MLLNENELTTTYKCLPINIILVFNTLERLAVSESNIIFQAAYGFS